jgi:hypothetical protein
MCLEAVFVLLESERIFYRLAFTPPSLVARSVLQVLLDHVAPEGCVSHFKF